MTAGISREMHERILKSFMDLIILKELVKNARISGYDVILLFHRRFHLLLSPGSVYSVLYAMERNGLVEGITTGEKRIYKISKKGEEAVRNFLRNRGSIQLLMESLLCK